MGDEVVSTPYGKFLIDPQDLIGSTIKAGTVWDGPGFLQVIAKEHVSLHSTVLDVGANQGSFTIWLASKGVRRVVAVEPVPEILQRLKANLDLNQATCAEHVVTIGVAGYDCSCLLTYTPIDVGNTGGTTLTPYRTDTTRDVQANPLDHYRWLWQDGLSLIKIDTEGCDGRVILGLSQSIQQHHPVIVFEWTDALAAPHRVSFEDVKGWLKAWGYQVYQWPGQPDNWIAIPPKVKDPY